MSEEYYYPMPRKSAKKCDCLDKIIDALEKTLAWHHVAWHERNISPHDFVVVLLGQLKELNK